MTSDASVARSSAAMAAGTIASRVLGVVRQSLIVAAIGQGVVANAFTTANTLPNVIYMIIAGGVLNSILIPQLVKAAGNPDGGREYTDRILTLTLSFFLVVTVIATACAGWLVTAYAARLTGDAVALATFFAVLTVPQIFFYGVYAVLGQILGARGRFTAFGWAPAVANVVAIAGLVAFMVLFDGHGDPGRWSPAMVWWFAGSATASIVAQALVLVVPLWRSGFRFTPRFGLRGVGLGTTSRVAGWAFGALLISQLGYLVASNVMWAATIAPDRTAQFVAGPAVYANALFVFMVPHSFVALSLITAMYPRLSAAAHARDTAALRRDYRLGLTLPTALTLPASVALLVFAVPIVGFLYRSPNPAELPATALVLAAMSLGVVPFGVDVLNQRFFYAHDDGRTAFVEQVVLTGTAIAVTLSSLAFAPRWTVPIIGAGIVVSNTAAAVYGMWRVRRRIQWLGGRRILLTWGRMAAAATLAGLVGWAVVVALGLVVTDPGRLGNLLLLVGGGATFALVYLVAARMLGVREIARLAAPLTRRLERR